MTWNCRNKCLLPLVATAAVTFFVEYVILIVSGQSSAAGFINIDCGKREDYSYEDADTELAYTSDFKYIDTGEIHGVDRSTIRSDHPKQAHDLRSFPTGARNCYTVKPVENGSKYLLKASFLYGNYDRKNSTPKFDLYLGVNFWDTISISNESINYVAEIITVTTSDQVSVCLINTGSGNPFISALELRPIPPDLYDPHLTSEETSKELVLKDRRNFAGNLERYPQDPYDRSWFKGIYAGLKILTTTSPVESKTKRYDPPSDVMKTATYPGSSSSFYYSWKPSTFGLRQNSGFLLIFHFAELQELKENETRILDITINDAYTVRKYFSPSYLVTTSIYASYPGALKKFVVRRSSNSTLPPIINAVEVFEVRNKTETETNSDDADAVAAIKVEYKVKKNWVGDPCFPTNFTWEGLNCSNEGFINLRIVSTNLSSSGLKGEISASFANLSELRYLNLSGNELTGGVPDAFESLTHLKILDLSRNRLNGYVPRKLSERSAAGNLTLRIDSKSESTSPGGPMAISKIIPIVIGVILSVIGVGGGITYQVYYKPKDDHSRVNTGGVVGMIQSINIHCCDCCRKSVSPRESNV